MAAEEVDEGHSARKAYACENCGQTFWRYQSHERRAGKRPRFCSRECRSAASRSGDFQCAGCGKLVRRKGRIADRLREGLAQVYCSPECRSRHCTVWLECPVCKTKFKRAVSQIARPGRGKYCSRACKDANGRVERTCSWPGCSNHFLVRSTVERYRGVERTVYKTEFTRKVSWSQYPICEHHLEMVHRHLGGKFRPNGRMRWLEDPEVNLGSRAVNSPVTRLMVFLKTEGQCAECGRAIAFDGGHGEWHVDHIQPVFKGGKTNLPNLQPLCVACHDCKSASEKSEVARLRHREHKVGRWLTHGEKDAVIAELRCENARLRAVLARYEEQQRCRKRSASTKSSRAAAISSQMSLRL